MKKLVIALLILFPFLSSGEDEPKSKPKITYFVHAEKHVRPTHNLIFIFDCSSSMGIDKRFYKAKDEMETILQYSLDDGMFSLIGFNTTFIGKEAFFIWPGIKEKDTPLNWARLPSLDAIKSADKYISSVKCMGWTNIYPAFEKAFLLNEDKTKLTIILLSDGNNTFPNWKGEMPDSVGRKIEKLQMARLKAGKDGITIFVFGVGKNQNVKMLSTIARAGGGSYLTTENYCDKCAFHTKARADFQQFHENDHE